MVEEAAAVDASTMTTTMTLSSSSTSTSSSLFDRKIDTVTAGLRPY
jgi:hypothetical protein